MERWQGREAGERAEKEQKLVHLASEVEEMIRRSFSKEEELKSYLRFRQKIPGYSVHNMTMIMCQRPEAKLVGSFQYWKKQGLSIKKGEHGMMVLVPIEHKNSGNVTFKPGYVFDITQTNADVEKMRSLLLHEKAEKLGAKEYGILLEAVINTAENIRIVPSAEQTGMDTAREYPGEGIVFLNPETAIREQMKAAVGFLMKMVSESEEERDGWEENLRMEMLYYVLCTRYGLDASEIHFEALRERSVQELTILEKKRLLGAVFSMADHLAERIDRYLAENRERKKDDKEEKTASEETLSEKMTQREMPTSGITSDEHAGIEDFGKKIGGARKDLWKERGLNVNDIAEMTDVEAAKYITKENIWKKPDYRKMLQEGTPLRVAFFIKEVRNALPAKVVYSYADKTPEQIRIRQENYISLIRDVEEQLLKVQNDADICRFFDSFVNRGDYITRGNSYSVHTTEKGFAVTNKLLRAMQVASYRLEAMDRKIAKEQFGVAEENKLPRGFSIRYLKQSQEYLVLKGRRVLADRLGSEQEAVQKARELQKSMVSSRKKKFVPEQLGHIRRDGPSNGITEEHPADGAMYMEDFGFAGGEFGNWMSEKDRQASLDMGYDAFCDLAAALEVAPSEIALGNHLSIAFGARGHGSAAAHYEPEREVINLTKMTGAGSLAHEWGHAFDDIIGKKLGLVGFMTEHIYDRRLPDSMKELVKALRWRSATEKEKREGNAEQKEITVETDFYKNSVKADAICSKEDKGYWSSNVEMFARAFACYVHDRLPWTSDYLCGHSESAVMIDFSKEEPEVIRAIPEGQEREQINRCFDKLFAECREMGLLKAADGIENVPGLEMAGQMPYRQRTRRR